MTFFQLLMLGISAFFAYKIYEHVQTLPDPQDVADTVENDVQSLLQEADELLDKKDFQKALTLYSEANHRMPHDSDTLFKMGYAMDKQERYDEAVEYYKEALEYDKNNTAFHQAIASAYRKMGEFASAKNHLNASLELDDSNPITYFNYGNLLVDMKHIDEAKEMYKNALEIDEDFYPAKHELEKLQ